MEESKYIETTQKIKGYKVYVNKTTFKPFIYMHQHDVMIPLEQVSGVKGMPPAFLLHILVKEYGQAIAVDIVKLLGDL